MIPPTRAVLSCSCLLIADCRYSHGVYVEALKNAVPVLDSEFVHGAHFMDAARSRQTRFLPNGPVVS
jgi:hypothetical protein